jgi:membrane-bound inhibitor of C-type lysozyme
MIWYCGKIRQILRIQIMINKLKQFLFVASLAAMLPSCSSYSLNPFSTGVKEHSRMPQNAIVYECDSGNQFYVRMQNNGNDAWLIYPDHEVNLTNSTDNKNRFTSGVITLLINGDETTLNDGEKIAYTTCKPQAKK